MRRLRGVSLIELVVALAIVAVLAAIAYPTYRAHALRTHRVAATACLHELALQMERRYASAMAYDQPAALPVARCTGEQAARYTFGFAGGRPSASAFRLQARPAGLQAADPCGLLWLDQLGQPGADGSGDVQSCWR